MKIEVPIVQFRLSDLAHIRSIELTGHEMIFDMVLLGERIIPMRRWVSLRAETYVRVLVTGAKLKLIKVEGIPVQPAAMEYKHKRKSLLFKLCFPVPPKDTDFVDLVEDESERKGCINQYGICISKTAEKNVKHYWQTISSVIEIPRN